MKRNIVLILIITLISASCSNNNKNTQQNPLLGSWKMEKVTWISSDKSYPINPAQAGIFLFTRQSYSIQWTQTKKPRTAFKNLSKPTEDEKKAAFSSVVFNAGSYTFTDNTVTTTAYIAKVPGFETGIQFYKYSINKDVLTITMFDETYPDGSKPDWAGKWQTEFVMSRIIK